MSKRRSGSWFLGLAVTAAALVALAAALAPSAASAAGNRKLVEGTVYDTTCVGPCVPCPPPCGPEPVQPRAAIVCAQKQRIVCPLEDGAPRICLPSSDCGGFPIYTGEGAVVNLRRRGSSTLLATLPIREGHFEIRLGPGEYVVHPYLPEPRCWSGVPTIVHVTRRLKSPVPATLFVANSCIVHPDAG